MRRRVVNFDVSLPRVYLYHQYQPCGCGQAIRKERQGAVCLHLQVAVSISAFPLRRQDARSQLAIRCIPFVVMLVPMTREAQRES